MRSHLFIPDTQVKPGVPLWHLMALGEMILDTKPDVIVMIGDFADMASLSTYERPGSKKMEGQRYADEIAFAREAMALLMQPVIEYNNRQRLWKKRQYLPELHLTLGNHEHRITRAIDSDPVKLEGVIGLNDLPYAEFGWKVHPFLDIVTIDGIMYSHYFTNPASLMTNCIGGTIDNKLRLLGNSFSMGHQQHRQYGVNYDALGRERHGLVAGAFYMHDEDYLGSQKNTQHWRGVVLKNEVKDGSYDPAFLSLKYVIKKWG